MKIELSFGRRFWISATLVVVAFTGYIVVRNLGHAYDMWREIGHLESERDALMERIASDSTIIEQLRYKEYVEEYARNKYHMQAADEEVFILED